MNVFYTICGVVAVITVMLSLLLLLL